MLPKENKKRTLNNNDAKSSKTVQTVRALAAKTDNLTLRTHTVEDPSPKCCPLTSTHMVGHKN